MNRGIFGCVACGCLVCGLAWFGYQESSNAQSDRTTRVEALQRRIDATVRERGALIAVAAQTAKSPAETIILNLAPDGTMVKKGDLVVELDTSRLETELRPLELQLASNEASVKLIRRTVARLSQQQELAVDVAAQRARVVELKAAALEEELKTEQPSPAASAASRAELKLAALEVQLSSLQLKQSIDDKLTQAEEELQKHLFEVKLLQAKLTGVKQKIAACTIRAEVDGILLYSNAASRRSEPVVIEPGAVVRERQMVAQIFDPAQLKLDVRVHESRITQVKRGQPVKIQFDAMPTRTFKGKVDSISPTALPGSWPNTDLKEYAVQVQMTDSREVLEGLRMGMTALAEINVAQ